MCNFGNTLPFSPSYMCVYACGGLDCVILEVHFDSKVLQNNLSRINRNIHSAPLGLNLICMNLVTDLKELIENI